MEMITCFDCNGHGMYWSKPMYDGARYIKRCTECNGSGLVEKPKPPKKGPEISDGCGCLIMIAIWVIGFGIFLTIFFWLASRAEYHT
jgi:hypothetical protein